VIIERRPALPGKIVIAFEQADMDLGGGTIWPEAKEAIKERFPYPESKWDPELKVWLIEDTKANLAGIQAIKKFYFENKNQLNLI
jgi:hypothetical protein